MPQLLARYPLADAKTGQGFLACLYELQEILKAVTGMAGVSLAPWPGQGEFAGVAMIRAYHPARGDTNRREIIVPDAAYGTNPATAIMCGYQVREIPTDRQGNVDFDALRKAVASCLPTPLRVFEQTLLDIQRIVHDTGGLTLLRRRQPERHPRTGAAGRHGL